MKLITVRKVNKVEWLRIDDDGFWHFDISLPPASVKRGMGRAPVIIIGRRHFKLKSARPIVSAKTPPQRRYHILCELLHTDPIP